MKSNIRLILTKQIGNGTGWDRIDSLPIPEKDNPAFFTLGNSRYQLRLEETERRKLHRRLAIQCGRRGGELS